MDMASTGQTPKSLKAQITRSSLVLAAAALLREEGPSAVTYRRVAKWAGAASSSVGYYFDSVTELLQEAAQYNIQMWAQRAERAALAAERLEPEACRTQCVDLLIKACLPEESTVPAAHYAQLIAASDSAVVTQAYQQGRVALDAAIERILTRAEIPMTPRLVVAAVDGAAVAAISEGYNVHETASNLLSEVVAHYTGCSQS